MAVKLPLASDSQGYFQRWTWPASTGGPCRWHLVDERLRRELEQAIKGDNWPLYLFGDRGVGKTCAVASLCRILSSAGYSVHWYEMAQIVADVVACRKGDGRVLHRKWVRGTEYTVDETEREILRKIQEAHFVVFNDLGIRATDPTYEITFSMIDSRTGKPTIFTSNLSPGELVELYDDRIVSRLTRGVVRELVGDDRRATTSSFARIKVKASALAVPK